MTIKESSRLFKAIGDENRLKIVNILKKGEHCACRLLESLDLTQPTLSHHMKQLCDCGLVEGRKEGKWIHYSLNQLKLQEAIAMLDALTQQTESSSTIPPMTIPTNQQVKLYLISGFLGAGKTTILTKLLENNEGKKIAVIQNEFGKLGIDGEIIRKNGVEMIELNRGSIFCSCLRLNFVHALSELAMMNPEYIFVESSGLGDPSNLTELIAAANLLCGGIITLSGSLGLADGTKFLRDLEDTEMVYRQIKHANLAVVTKVDLISPEELTAIKAKIQEINPHCLVRISSKGSLDLGFLGEDITHYHNADHEPTVNMVDNKPKTISLLCEEEVDRNLLIDFLNEVKGDCFRIKGFFNLIGEGFHQVDVVGDRIDIIPAKERESSQLVFISKIGPAVIKKVFDQWNRHLTQKMSLKN